MASRNYLINFFILISAILVITSSVSSTTTTTNTTASSTEDKTQKREDGDSSSDDSDSDSSSSDSGPSPIHSSYPMSPYGSMFPRMPFPPMGPSPFFGGYRPMMPPMGPMSMGGGNPMSMGGGSPMSPHPMAASMMRPVMSPLYGPAGGHQPQPLFAPMSHPMAGMVSPMSQMASMVALQPAMRRAWEGEPSHHGIQSITGHSLFDQLLHSESHPDPLTEPFGHGSIPPLLGGEPIEQMDEEEFYEKLRQHQREKEQRQTASRREFRDNQRDSYGAQNRRRAPSYGPPRGQIPPPSTHSYDDRNRDNGGYHDNRDRSDPYEPMQEENRYDRGHHDHNGNSNYVGNQRDPMEYDDRPVVDRPPMENSRPPGPPGEERDRSPPYVRRSIHDERSNSDYGMYDDKKA